MPSVLVMNDEGKAELRMLRLGASQGKTHVAVASGLKQGDKIVNNPPSNASSGWMPNTQ